MTTERSFFVEPIRQRLLRASQAVCWAERRFLTTRDADDFSTLLEAQAEKKSAVRAMLAVQALVAA